MQNKPVNCFSDRKIMRKTIHRSNLRSPKSMSSSNSANGFFIKNVTKPFFNIDHSQRKFYNSIRTVAAFAQQEQKCQSFQGTKSQNEIKRNKKKPQNTLKEKSQNQISEKLKLDHIIGKKKGRTSQIDDINDKVVKQLRQQNKLLKSKLKIINKRLQNSLKGKQQPGMQNIMNNRFTNNSHILRDSKIQELQKSNSQLVQEVNILKQKLKKDDNLADLVSNYSLQQHKNIQNKYKQLNLYVGDLQSKYIILREQNQKIKIELDCLKRKSFTQIQALKKLNIKEMSSIKEKYFKLLAQHKDLTKQHYDLVLKLKRLQKQLIMKKIDSKLLQTSLTLSQCSQIHKQ